MLEQNNLHLFKFIMIIFILIYLYIKKSFTGFLVIQSFFVEHEMIILNNSFQTRTKTHKKKRD